MNTKTGVRLLGLIVSTVAATATAQEVVIPWRAVEITPATVSGVPSDLRVRVEFCETGGVVQVTAIRLLRGEAMVSAPPAALEAARGVVPASVVVSWENDGAGEPLLYVSLACGRASLQGPARDPLRVYFVFRGGRFLRRFVARQVKDGGREFTDVWAP